MPLLIYAAGWWLVGLFTGALLGQWATRPAWLAGIMLLAGIMVALAWRSRRLRAVAALPLVGIGLAGVLASASAADDARICRAATVERMARGEWVSLRFDGAATERAGPARPRRGRVAGTAETAPANGMRGRGTVRFALGARRCAVAASVRLPGALGAGDIADAHGTELLDLFPGALVRRKAKAVGADHHA